MFKQASQQQYHSRIYIGKGSKNTTALIRDSGASPSLRREHHYPRRSIMLPAAHLQLLEAVLRAASQHRLKAS